MLLKKILTIAISIILVLALIIGIFLLCFYNFGVKPSPVETLTVGDGENIRVGIISDTQLPPTKKASENNPYKEHLTKALKILKEQNVEMVIHAGDIGDMNSSYSYQTYNEVFNSVFGKDSDIATLYIMGNHDLWQNADYWSYAPKQRKYTKNMGQSPFTHKVVNGFHFIGASPDKGSNVEGYLEKNVAWLEEQIQIAEKDTPDMPIFVITHHNPKDTAYGSDLWSDPHIDEVFRKYSNIVSISGHSHYSMLDERSIYQNKYTALTTQSLAYIEMESGKFDAFKGDIATIPPRDDEKPMMLIMNVSKDSTSIERWNVTDNKEEKSDMRWTLNYPLTADNFIYSTLNKENSNSAPSMAASSVSYNPAVKSHLKTVTAGEETLQGITFNAGTDDDFVHSYKVVLRGEKDCEYTYFSDFYNGIDSMTKTVDIALDKELPAGNYSVKVYAVDSFGIMSSDYASGNITLSEVVKK